MLETILIIILHLAASESHQPDSFHIVLTDVTQNTYVDQIRLEGSRITPDCQVRWTISKHVLRGGRQQGVDVIVVNNGKLRFTLVPTRGMSIYELVMGDIRLGWDSPVKGLVHPNFINLDSRQGLGWLEGFNEWLVRCGLEFLGAPGTDEFTDNTGKKAHMELTLHGKIANVPASRVEITVDRLPPYQMSITGLVEETSMHGPKIELYSEISTTPGSNTIHVADKVTNRSAKEQEFGILYHANFGTPLMEDGAKFVAPVRRVTPINEHSAKDLTAYDSYGAPTADVAEQVYCLQLWAEKDNRTTVMLRNAAGDKAVTMSFSIVQLPYFTLWKNPTAIEDGYVTGLEPGTSYSLNRSVERKFGRVPKLAPHQSRPFSIDFTVLENNTDVQAAQSRIKAVARGRQTVVDSDPITVK